MASVVAFARGVLARANEVAHGFVGGVGHAHGCEFTGAR
jgi:hypothetical protein